MSNSRYVIFHHSFDKIAGTERVIYNLLEFFSAKPDASVTLLLAGKPAGLALSLDHLPVDVIYLNVEIEPGNPLKLITSHTALYKSLKKELNRWDKNGRYISLATNPFLAILMKLGAGKLKLNMAVVACEHFSLSVSGKLSLIARKLFYKYLYVVTLTQKDKDIIANKYRPLQCTCIPNASPFDITPYHSFPREKVILSIGRLSVQKGFDMLIQSYALIATKHPDWKLVIVGDDYGEKGMLEKLIRDNALQNVITIIPATKQIESYYRNAAFYVLSSRFEGLPMVLIEAMSFGLPLVAFDCPTGPAELIDSHNGMLVENGNIEKLAEAMDLLISSPELLDKIALGAENHAVEFSKGRINVLWENFLNKIELK